MARFSFEQQEADSGRMTVELGPPAGPRDRYSAELMCCQNPGCDCGTLDLRLAPLEDAGSIQPTVNLTLRVEERRVVAPSGFRAIGEQLSSRFSDDDWSLAGSIYRRMKADASEVEDAADLDVAFPQKVVADPAMMVGYTEVFPLAEDPYFEHDGRVWAVWEYYCSNPGCSCASVRLDFAARPVDEAAEKWTVERADVTGLSFDHRSGRFSLEVSGPREHPPAARLIGMLRERFPDFQHRLARRQRVLRALHAKARGAQVPPERATVVREKKIGRNERCPCGSGKKYKACCGRCG